MPNFRLYVILDEETLRHSHNIIEVAKQVISGGVEVLQLRAKGLSDEQIIDLGRAIKDVVRKKALFLLNDRADLALALDADGVHLGQGDLPVKAARKMLGKHKIIGRSTHSVEQAVQAQEQGADYIAIGPIFATATKPGYPPLTPAIIPEIQKHINRPYVAIGGINLDNLSQILSSGAHRVAVCRAIIHAQDVLKATRDFRHRLYGALSTK